MPSPTAIAGPLRRIGLALVLAALWVQFAGPALALRPASGGPDPLGGAIICGQASGLRGEAPPPGLPACKACPLCAVGLATPLLPAAPALPRRLTWTAIAWPIPPPARPRPGERPAGRIRAPPISS